MESSVLYFYMYELSSVLYWIVNITYESETAWKWAVLYLLNSICFLLVMKKSFVYTCLASFSVISMQAQTASSPNIVLIMADDLGWGDVGFNGNTCIRTPYMDQLASEGIVFEQFYSSAPLSSPTRASVLTGRNAYRMGVFAPNVGILRPEEVTLPELLKEKGYLAGHFGKWHLGTLTCKEVDANRGRPENVHLLNPPAEHGYDEAFVTESKVPTFDPMSAPALNDGRFWDYISEGEDRKAYGTSYWDINGNKVTEGLRGDDSRIIIDHTLPFIDRALKKNKPFLATIWFHAPHLPCVAGPEHVALYKDFPLKERNYYGCITAMDEQIGRLVRYLKVKGIYENTIIFFCSDNGPELNTPGTAGQFKGKKRSLHEGGIRVPAFMIDGRRKVAGRVKQPCSTSDYLPTVLELVGLSEERLNPIDGESFVPFLSSPEAKRHIPLVFCSGTQGAVIDDGYKLYYNNGVSELYCLEKDPLEQKEVGNLYPDVLKRMFKYLKEQMSAYEDSFDGKEYGTSSVNRMGQKWENIFLPVKYAR